MVADGISFNQWENTDRCNIYQTEISDDDFVDELVIKLESLASHHFIAKQQMESLKIMKDGLDDRTCLVILDFAEN